MAAKRWPKTVGKWSRDQEPDWTLERGNTPATYVAHGEGGYGPISELVIHKSSGVRGKAGFDATLTYRTASLPEWSREDYDGLTRQQVLDLMTARSKARKMTAKELVRIGTSRKAQKGVQWKQALVELNRRGKGPDGTRKGKARSPGASLWNPRRRR
jgi:hypothetical protein